MVKENDDMGCVSQEAIAAIGGRPFASSLVRCVWFRVMVKLTMRPVSICPAKGAELFIQAVCKTAISVPDSSGSKTLSVDHIRRAVAGT